MAKKIYGFVKNEINQPVEFAVVYTSDKNGKPVGGKSTQSDEKGRFSIDAINDSDFLTASMTGLKPSTVKASSAINVPSTIGVMPTVLIKMNPSEFASLPEVKVTPKETTSNPTKPKQVAFAKPNEQQAKEEPKKEMNKYLKYSLIGGGILLAIIITVAVAKKIKEKNK
jgi:hypothetical protein